MKLTEQSEVVNVINGRSDDVKEIVEQSKKDVTTNVVEWS